MVWTACGFSTVAAQFLCIQCICNCAECVSASAAYKIVLVGGRYFSLAFLLFLNVQEDIFFVVWLIVHVFWLSVKVSARILEFFVSVVAMVFCLSRRSGRSGVVNYKQCASLCVCCFLSCIDGKHCARILAKCI